jgi:hypothetical protein
MVSTAFVVFLLAQATSSADYEVSGGRGFRAFDPLLGTINCVRFFVDRLVLVQLGWRHLPASLFATALLLAAFVIGAARAISRKPQLAAVAPGVAVALFGLAGTIPFRCWEPYGNLCFWSRYLLIPHFGMTLVIALAFANTVTIAKRDSIQPSIRFMAFFLTLLALWTGFQSVGLHGLLRFS